MCVHDDLFAKVPRSNVGLQSRLKSCNTLRCLTMFANDGQKSHLPPNVVDTMFPYEKLSPSSSCKVVLGDFIDRCNGRNRRQVLISRHGMFKDTNRLWRFTLFYIEFVFSKGVCMIYDGLNVPGRAKKSSGLLHEFSTMHLKHLDVVRGISSPFKNTHGLLYGEKRELMQHLEHDRMLYSNYGRQNAVLDDDNDDDECGGGLIDEVRFHLQRRHAQSNLQSWKLKESSTKFLLLGGMRSPCPNGVTYKEDYMGKTVHTFDGVFNSERERERFYVECMLRRLSSEGSSIDVMGCVNVCRMLSYCRASLEDYAIKNDLPRSAVRVDEDFHYMRGKCGANNNIQCTNPMAWPGQSVFLRRDYVNTLPLNKTLSLSVVAKKKSDKQSMIRAVEALKFLLFKDGLESHVDFFELHKGRNRKVPSCCDCSYLECDHYDLTDHDKVLDEETKTYLRSTCPYCLVKVGKRCDETTTMTCCIRAMRTLLLTKSSVEELWNFVKDCHHFTYEMCAIDFVVEGNPFENAERHTERYFNYIDSKQDMSSQRLLSTRILVKDHLLDDDKQCCSREGGLMSNLCKPSKNGVRCVTCERQPIEHVGKRFVEIRPRVNKDNARKQIAKRVNVCAINDLSLRKIRLDCCGDLLTYGKKIRETLGFCGMNCNQRHNVSSSLSYLPIYFRTKMNDTAHWPRQNYERDHASNVNGVECGCGRPWQASGQLHNFESSSCGWMKATGDVICGDFDANMHEGINPITLYVGLATSHACRCIPSMSLLKHMRGRSRIREGATSSTSGRCSCGWNEAVCSSPNCSTCIHYCSLSFTC